MPAIRRDELPISSGAATIEIIEDARIEDRNHFEALVPWIYELGGALHRDVKDFCKDAACPDARLPSNFRDMGAMLNVLVEAERCAIRVYTEICELTAGKDPCTYDLAAAILNEEIEHDSWFSEFLGETPSGHFRRGAPGESPYMPRFLTVPKHS